MPLLVLLCIGSFSTCLVRAATGGIRGAVNEATCETKEASTKLNVAQLLGSNSEKKWGDAVELGYFVCGVPMNEPFVFCIDTRNATNYIQSNSLSPGKHQYSGAVGITHILYAFPVNADRILKVELGVAGHQSLQASYIGESLGTDHHKWYDTVLASNGALYGIPAHADKVIKMRIKDETWVKLDTELGDGLDKWRRGVAVRNFIYACPYNSMHVLKISTDTDNVELIGEGISSTAHKWGGTALASDGSVYCIPRDATTVMRIDPRNDKITEFGKLDASSHKWKGAMAWGDFIYATPSSTRGILKVDTKLHSVETIWSDTIPTDDGIGEQFGGGVIVGRKLYLMPEDVDGIWAVPLCSPHSPDLMHLPLLGFYKIDNLYLPIGIGAIAVASLLMAMLLARKCHQRANASARPFDISGAQCVEAQRQRWGLPMEAKSTEMAGRDCSNPILLPSDQ